MIGGETLEETEVWREAPLLPTIKTGPFLYSRKEKKEKV